VAIWVRERRMAEKKALDREAAKEQPQDVFSSPLEIVDEELFTKGEKLATLERWRQGILEQLAATSENADSWCLGEPYEGVRGDRRSKAPVEELILFSLVCEVDVHSRGIFGDEALARATNALGCKRSAEIEPVPCPKITCRGGGRKIVAL
jgi:hypothetical protein